MQSTRLPQGAPRVHASRIVFVTARAWGLAAQPAPPRALRIPALAFGWAF